MIPFYKEVGLPKYIEKHDMLFLNLAYKTYVTPNFKSFSLLLSLIFIFMSIKGRIQTYFSAHKPHKRNNNERRQQKPPMYYRTAILHKALV